MAMHMRYILQVSEMKTMEAKWNLSTAKIISPVKLVVPITWGNRAGGNLVPLVISVATISNNCSMVGARSLWKEKLNKVNYGVTTVPSSKSIPRGPYRKKQRKRRSSTLPTHLEPSLGLLRNNFIRKVCFKVKIYYLT